MINKFDKDWLLKEVTTYGNGTTLKTARPKDGVAGYVWRMIRFDSGKDTTFPTSCVFYLADQIEKDHPGIKFRCGIFSEFEKTIFNILDVYVAEILDDLGLNKFAGALRWRGLI